jgi:hypothetical protein
MHPLTLFGLLFNCVLILMNRYVKHLPDWLYISCMILAIAAMIAGAFIRKA